MNPQTLNLIATMVIVLLTTWACLTHRVKTNSLEILLLGVINIAGAIGVIEALNGIAVPFSQTVMRAGIATLGIVYFLKVEILPHIWRGKNGT